MQSRYVDKRFSQRAIQDIPVPADTSYDPDVDDAVDRVSGRDFGDILNDIKEYLTREERVCISLFKNSKKQRNQIYRAFLECAMPEKYGEGNQYLSSSAITHKKKKILKVLAHVGALVRYKQERHVDILLKEILTTRQYVVLMMYERRLPNTEIQSRLKISTQSLMKRYHRAIERIEEENNPTLQRYLTLLGNVLRFSRKRNIH